MYSVRLSEELRVTPWLKIACNYFGNVLSEVSMKISKYPSVIITESRGLMGSGEQERRRKRGINKDINFFIG